MKAWDVMWSDANDAMCLRKFRIYWIFQRKAFFVLFSHSLRKIFECKDRRRERVETTGEDEELFHHVHVREKLKFSQNFSTRENERKSKKWKHRKEKRKKTVLISSRWAKFNVAAKVVFVSFTQFSVYFSLCCRLDVKNIHGRKEN